MRYSALVLSTLLVSFGLASAQTGFSTKSYPAVLPASSDNRQILSSDLNGDGRPDLVSFGSRYNGAAPINVFLNNGSGGFLAPTAIAGSSATAFAQIGDMNGDGYPDIVACSNAGSGQTQAVVVTVYLNSGTGTFNALPAVSYNGQCNALTLGNVERNGRLDVVTVGYTPGQYGPGGQFYPGNRNTLNLFTNDGTGKLSIKEAGSVSVDDPGTSSNFTNCGLIDVVGGDFQQNGNFDLILTSSCQPTNKNFPANSGTTSYAPYDATNGYAQTTHLQSAYETYTNGKVADVNGDGKLDVLFDGDQGSGLGGDLVLFMNTGNGTFSISSLLTAYHVYGSTVADFNGDGYRDIAVVYDQASNGTQAPPMMGILSGTANGTFTDSQDFAIGSASQLGGDVVAADFNGDGKSDLATLVYDTASRTTGLNVYTNTQSGSSNACPTPTTVNTNKICSPTSGSTNNSPVTVNAASNVSGFTLNRLYLDNTSVYQTTSQQVSTPIDAATGNHTLVLVSYNNTGQAFTSTVNFTVGTATGNGCIPTSAGASICSPSNGSTDNSPITVIAGARAQSGNITAIRIYVDDVARGTYNNPSMSPTFQINQGGFDFGGGTHHLVIVGYQSTGGSVTSSIYFSEPSTPCMAPTTGDSLKLCTPSSTSAVSSPFTVSANAYTQSGYIAAMRVYIDNAAVALINNPNQSKSFTINQSVSATAGTHTLVVVAYPSGGGSLAAQENITVQ